MTYDDAINTFRNHLNKLNQFGTDFDVWLSTAIEHVDEIFTLLSPQHNSIIQIKNDYSIAKIGNNSSEVKNMYAYKAKQLIENFIERLEDKKRIALEEANQQKQNEAKIEIQLQEQFDNLKYEYKGLFDEKRKLENELKDIREAPKPKRIYLKVVNGMYQFNIILFWTLVPLILALTYYLASLKFDTDKMNLFEKNQELKSDTANLSSQLRTLHSEIESMKSKRFSNIK